MQAQCPPLQHGALWDVQLPSAQWSDFHMTMSLPVAALQDIDALRDVSAAVNSLKKQRADMGILMVTHYKVRGSGTRGGWA